MSRREKRSRKICVERIRNWIVGWKCAPRSLLPPIKHCGTRYRDVPALKRRPWSSRRRLPKSCGSSQARRASCRRYSRRYWKTQSGFARRSLGYCSCMQTVCSAQPPCLACRRYLASSSPNAEPSGQAPIPRTAACCAQSRRSTLAQVALSSCSRSATGDNFLLSADSAGPLPGSRRGGGRCRRRVLLIPVWGLRRLRGVRRGAHKTDDPQWLDRAGPVRQTLLPGRSIPTVC